MKRKLVQLVLAVICLSMLTIPAQRTRAQEANGSICISTYADTNMNGIHEDTEALLPGVNVNLSVASVIVATHVFAATEMQYCFQNLQPGVYTVTFTNSPTYQGTTASEGTVQVTGSDPLIVSFGAVPIPQGELGPRVAADTDEAENNSDKTLEPSVRLLLSTGGSMVMMLFMIGIGAVILGLMGSRRRTQRVVNPYEPPMR